MKVKVLLNLFVLVILTSSCVHEKVILKSNQMALLKSYAGGPTGTDSLFFVQPQQPFKAQIDNKGDYLVIITDTNSKVDTVGSKELTTLPIAWQQSVIYDANKKPQPKTVKYYFPDADTVTFKKKGSGDIVKVTMNNSFKYLDAIPVLQTLAIPFKIRPGLKDNELGKIPPQAESGFTVAIAGGVKLSRNVYRPTKNLFNQNISSTSLTPGLFLGSGTTDLSTKNTSGPKITADRKAVLISTGGFLMVGADRFNIGYAFGFDNATGPGRKQWIYKGELWHAVVIGLDLIK